MHTHAARFANRRTGLAAGLALLLGGLLAFAFYPSSYPPYDEGRDYVAIATHHYTEVTSYYGNRILHPLFVRLFSAVFHTPIDAHLFIGVSLGCLIALFVFLAVWYATENLWAPSLCLLLIATPVVIDAYRNYYWHDLFYAALCALFFLLLRRSLWLALPLLFLLYLTRESTVILVVVLLGLAALRRRWTFCLSVLLIAIAGAKIPAAMIGHALTNRHGISPLLLDVLKVPYNFFYNVCGLVFWTNTDASTLLPPIWRVALPAWLHVGRIREVGYSGFFWTRPAQTLLILSASFGIFPMVAARTAVRDWKNLTHRRFDLAAAFWYGALMFVLTPLVGTLPGRYVIYAWPVFWLFGMEMLNSHYADARVRSRIIFWSLLAAWTPAVIRLLSKPPIAGPESLYDLSTGGLILSLVLVAAIYFRAWRLVDSAAPSAK